MATMVKIMPTPRVRTLVPAARVRQVVETRTAKIIPAARVRTLIPSSRIREVAA
jgi:hypothetical protein